MYCNLLLLYIVINCHLLLSKVTWPVTPEWWALLCWLCEVLHLTFVPILFYKVICCKLCNFVNCIWLCYISVSFLPLQGWYIVTYALGIYQLNLFIAFLTPKMEPVITEDSGIVVHKILVRSVKILMHLNLTYLDMLIDHQGRPFKMSQRLSTYARFFWRWMVDMSLKSGSPDLCNVFTISNMSYK